MLLADLMSTKLVTVGPDTDIEHLRAVFVTYTFHHVLVVEGRKLVGVISDRDVLREISPFVDKLGERPQDEATLHRRAHQIMSRKLIVAAKHETVAVAVERMLAHRISCLPIVTPDWGAEGIVTWRDVVRPFIAA